MSKFGCINKIYILVSCLFFVSCTTPPMQTQIQASSDLNGDCLSMFMNTRFGNGYGYQYFAAMRRYFAVGYYANGSKQVCGFYGNGWSAHDEFEAQRQAIASCNSFMPTKSGCVLYANGNEIVFDKSRALAEGKNQDQIYSQNRGVEQKNINSKPKIGSGAAINEAKDKCKELGFKPNTEGFGKCVLQLSK